MSTTKYGFTKMTPSEFKTWIKNQGNYNYSGIQVHHTWMPSYENFYKSDGSHEDELERQRNMKSFHVNNNHWGDIAQHFTIFPNGVIVTGRKLANTTAIGIKGWNSNKICIEIYGNFDKGHDKMTEEQKNAVITVYGELCKKFRLTPSTSTIRCHCWFTAGGTYLGDYSSSKSAKTCPGTNFMGFGNSKSAIANNFIPMIKNYISGEPIEESNSIKPSTGDKNVKALQMSLNSSYGLKLTVDGSFGPKTKSAVKSHYLKAVNTKAKAHTTWVQESLKSLGYSIDVDGSYGNGSASTVKKFQKDNKLSVDGIAGLETHLKLIDKLKSKK